jgi:hypothetical protein
MLEKGKGRFIENLCIIQLCEVDLNFLLHTIWGHRLIHHASTHHALDKAQYALPGETYNNTVLNKTLFLDLSRQTLSPGISSDFDATAAFDRVIAGLSIVTCERVGLPRPAGLIMFHLLRQMKFHLITCFGKSFSTCENTMDNTTGQGVLQGSSSACPIYILNSNVSLSAYRKTVAGASFKHPITGGITNDLAVQFVDDTSQFVNSLGISINNAAPTQDDALFHNFADARTYNRKLKIH